LVAVGVGLLDETTVLVEVILFFQQSHLLVGVLVVRATPMGQQVVQVVVLESKEVVVLERQIRGEMVVPVLLQVQALAVVAQMPMVEVLHQIQVAMAVLEFHLQ
jgi:hypothetical protein